MRRILWMAAVGVLVLAMAAPAMALDFKFGGLARTRFYDQAGVGFDNSQATNPGNNVRGADMLFLARFDASDDNGNILSVLRFRIGKIVFGAGGGTENPSNWASPAPISTFGVGGGGKTGASNGGGFGGRGVNIETNWAYLDFAMPFNIPLRIRAGLQPWYEPKGLIIDDNATGVRAYGTVAPFSYEAAWYRLDAGNNFGPGSWISNGIGLAGRYKVDVTDNNYDVYGAKVNVALIPWFNPGLYFYYGDNRVNCSGTSAANTPCPAADRVRPNWYLGYTTTGKVGIVSYDFDFVYGWAKGGPTGAFIPGTINTATSATPGINTNVNVQPIVVKGFVFDAGIHFPVGPVTLNFGGSYASGDDQHGGDSGAFPGGYGPAWNGPMGAYEFIGGGGTSGFDVLTNTQSSVTNLWTLGTYATYNPVKALTLKAAYAFAGFSTKNGNCATIVAGSNSCFGPVYTGRGFTPGVGLAYAATAQGAAAVTNLQGTGGLAGRTTLGNEIDLQAFYRVWTGFSINGMVGWFVPTKGDTASKYFLNFVYSF